MYNIILHELLLPLVTSFFIALLATYIVRIVAIKLKWISIPREERWNTRYVALMGGIGVFVSFVSTFLLFQSSEYLMVGFGAVIMFGVGFWDDRLELKPIAKFLVQFIAASLLIATGFTISSVWPFWIAIPLTYLWIIGITNAFNLLDNMDGLAGGTAVIISTVFGILSLKLGMPAVGMLSFILAGASAGFLVFNYNPAKIFMGDCGSLFIGYLLAAIPLMLEPAITAVAPASVLPVLVAVTILPIFDTTLVTFLRLFKGRSPSQGGSDHSSHRLVFSGLSERRAVHILYGISVFFGINVLLFYPGSTPLFYILFAISLVGIFFFGLYMSRMDVYEDESLSSIESMVEGIPAYFKRKIQLGAIIADIVLIIASFALAHFIRFEGWSTEVDQAVMKVIPGIIVLKILIMAGMGLYKSVWKYAGVADLTKLIIATFVGSLAAGIFSWLYFGGYISVSVFAIDWFLFLFLLASSRFAFKGLRRLFAIPANGGKNVLIYGAGDAGWLALSEIRQNPDLHLDPVGFLDDSPYKQKGKIQGLKILGSYHKLLTLCKEHEVEEVLICIRNLSKDKKEMVQYMCNKDDIRCREFSPIFDDLGSEREAKNVHLDYEYQE
jgi:UDP-GlcNAc:undecaprenyl-phosphate GlcNAc-1-phosphate transferase